MERRKRSRCKNKAKQGCTQALLRVFEDETLVSGDIPKKRNHKLTTAGLDAGRVTFYFLMKHFNFLAESERRVFSSSSLSATSSGESKRNYVLLPPAEAENLNTDPGFMTAGA